MSDYYTAAEEVMRIHRDDPEYRDKIAAIIKRFGHTQKLDAYSTVFTHVKHLPRNPRVFKKCAKRFFAEYLPSKIATHEDFSTRGYRKQIHGLFDWQIPEKPKAPAPKRFKVLEKYWVKGWTIVRADNKAEAFNVIKNSDPDPFFDPDDCIDFDRIETDWDKLEEI